ncbi:uncharacterized protein LOC114641141 [Erpetoichthys calabaricus]|uniref:uncharacterized protein LOC114641141 n=1 Tax=Erpetoichthys calabaricus TaxID=27687 RepID=UPI00109FC9E7|nr:uncharacterized protein LOC114641141 [Erpetoichthys calabaricus]
MDINEFLHCASVCVLWHGFLCAPFLSFYSHGSDVSVFCEHTNSTIYWFRLQHPAELPVPVLHTYGPDDENTFRYPGTSDRFSVTTDGTLVIVNATEEDKNSYYYCVEKDKNCEIFFRNITNTSRKNKPEDKEQTHIVKGNENGSYHEGVKIALAVSLFFNLLFLVLLGCMTRKRLKCCVSNKSDAQEHFVNNSNVTTFQNMERTLSENITSVYAVINHKPN